MDTAAKPLATTTEVNRLSSGKPLQVGQVREGGQKSTALDPQLCEMSTTPFTFPPLGTCTQALMQRKSEKRTWPVLLALMNTHSRIHGHIHIP